LSKTDYGGTTSTGFLQYIDVSNCQELKEDFIFYGRELLGELAWIDLSYNKNITILGLACLCSYGEIKLIKAHGVKLTPNECLFLCKTFENVERGDCEIETEDGVYPLRIYCTFQEEFTL